MNKHRKWSSGGAGDKPRTLLGSAPDQRTSVLKVEKLKLPLKKALASPVGCRTACLCFQTS